MKTLFHKSATAGLKIRDLYVFFQSVLAGCGLYFCLSFIYNLLRPFKKSLVTTLSSAGSEIVPFLKIFGIIPGAFLITLLYLNLCKVLKRNQIFYVMLSLFLGYFALFAFVLYPNSEFFALKTLGQFLRGIMPEGYRGFVTMVEYWHASLFYVLCELWSSAIMAVLFWGFMNETTTLSEATKSYAFYNFFGNLAAIVAGHLVTELTFFDLKGFLTDINLGFLASKTHVCNCFYVNIFICLIVGLVAIFLFRYLTTKTQENPVQEKTVKAAKKVYKPSKAKYGFFESVNLVLKSKYLFCLLILVVAYNAVFVWHDALLDQTVKEFFNSSRTQILRFNGDILKVKGYFSCVFAMLTPVLIMIAGWKRVALLTPVILLVSSLIFFPLIYLQDNVKMQGFFQEFFATDMMLFLVWLGGRQNSLVRGSKYSVYDTTKEMAFIPLPTEEKRESKVILDGIASRFGKSSGSILLVILLYFFNNLKDTTPFLLVFSVIITVAWIYAIYVINRSLVAKDKNL